MFPFSFRWVNFRCFPDTGWVEIKPLTIILGPNNSGKSSLLAPLLMMKQTLESADESVSLLTKGPLVSVGSFGDLIRNHDTALPLRLNLRYHYYTPVSGEELEDVGAYPPGAFSASFRATDKLVPADFELQSYRVFDIYSRPFLTRIRSSGSRFSLRFFPKQEFDRKTRDLIRTYGPEHFIFTDRPIHKLLRDIISRDKKDRQTSKLSLSPGASIYFSAVSTVEVELDEYFGTVSYIGPLRTPIKRLYEFSGEAPKNVGVKGENTPEIVARGIGANRDAWIQKWANSFEFGGSLVGRRGKHDTFVLEVNRTNRESSTNLADMGSGLSQVLPLFVQGAFSPENGTLITEQPEIHLNPKLQCLLADLFVDIAKSGRRVVVETHSEHLLLRVRRLVAERQIRSDQVAIYFVERERDGSAVRGIPIQPNGHILAEHWPRGFFEDSLREALGLAASQQVDK